MAIFYSSDFKFDGYLYGLELFLAGNIYLGFFANLIWEIPVTLVQMFQLRNESKVWLISNQNKIFNRSWSRYTSDIILFNFLAFLSCRITRHYYTTEWLNRYISILYFFNVELQQNFTNIFKF